MTVEEYRAKLAELEKSSLPYLEYCAKVAELEAEYLAEQTVPDAEKAIELILEAKERGELPELEAGINLEEDWKKCEALELLDEDSPDERVWRCRVGDCEIDVCAETGEVILMSA
jgi:hypothetical protein